MGQNHLPLAERTVFRVAKKSAIEDLNIPETPHSLHPTSDSPIRLKTENGVGTGEPQPRALSAKQFSYHPCYGLHLECPPQRLRVESMVAQAAQFRGGVFRP